MIVITGASGHVGNNLVRELNKRGIKPRILIHEATTVWKALEGLDFEEVKGDTRDLESLKKAFEGADLVYNCAAAISIKCGVYDKIKTVNVDGVRNVVEACIADKVRRLVHVSSIEALGDPGEGVVATEELGFNLFSCGHHRTEIFGVRALGQKIQAELGIPAKFVDIDNPV